MTFFQFRFWFEWRAGTAFWAANEPAYQEFGVGPIAPERLPLVAETCRRIRAMAEWHDGYLNWDDPSGPSLWREQECHRFNEASRALYEQVVRELGAGFDVIYAQATYHEDPDLALYLTDRDEYDRRHGRGSAGRAKTRKRGKRR